LELLVNLCITPPFVEIGLVFMMNSTICLVFDKQKTFKMIMNGKILA